MSNIEARLKDIFEKYNIVFWYDDEGKLKGSFILIIMSLV